jgi:hypothetical protein
LSFSGRTNRAGDSANLFYRVRFFYGQKIQIASAIGGPKPRRINNGAKHERKNANKCEALRHSRALKPERLLGVARFYRNGLDRRKGIGSECNWATGRLSPVDIRRTDAGFEHLHYIRSPAMRVAIIAAKAY